MYNTNIQQNKGKDKGGTRFCLAIVASVLLVRSSAIDHSDATIDPTLRSIPQTLRSIPAALLQKKTETAEVNAEQRKIFFFWNRDE
jgi:hypothetical protein